MKFAYDRYILPDWVLTMQDYRDYTLGNYEQPPSIQSEPPPEMQLEIEHRMAQVAAEKAARGHIPGEYSMSEERHSHAIHRCRGNGSHHKSNMIGRNY